MCLVDCRELELAVNRNGDWNRSQPRSYRRYLVHLHMERGYLVFLQALHDTTRALVQPLNPAIVLDLLYATMILALIRRIYFDSASSQGIPMPKLTEDGSPTTGSECVAHQPMMLILKSSKKMFSELCDDVHRTNVLDPKYLEGCLGNPEPGHDRMFMNSAASLLRISGTSDTLVEVLKRLIDRVELK